MERVGGFYAGARNIARDFHGIYEYKQATVVNLSN